MCAAAYTTALVALVALLFQKAALAGRTSSEYIDGPSLRKVLQVAQHRRLQQSSADTLAPLPEELRADCEGKDPESRDNKKCWLWDYLVFHRKMRGHPDAKYLVWVCFGAHRGRDNVYPNDCAGLGDRLRGIEYSLRLANSMNRVLLVHQEVPAPMTTFFLPTVIDWRLTDDLHIMLNPGMRHIVLGDENWNPLARPTREMLHNHTLEAFQDRVVTIASNYFLDFYAGSKSPPVYEGDMLMNIIAASLFKLSPAIEERVDKVLKDMGIREGEEYVAFHLRLGNLEGEKQRQTRHSLKNATDEEVLKIAQQCAVRLSTKLHASRRRTAAQSMTVPQETPPRIVLITDDIDLRQKAIDGKLWPWVSPNVHPVHFSQPEHVFEADYYKKYQEEIEKHLQNMADFGILARATCLIVTRSGFSTQARLLGPRDCHTTIDNCLTYNQRSTSNQ